MKDVRWIIQENLLDENEEGQLQEVCSELDIPYEGVTVVPFSEDLPDFSIDNDHKNFYYGSTNFIKRVTKKLGSPLGVFYDPDTFSMENYLKRWGKHMLNSNGKIMTVREFLKKKRDRYGDWFIRPNGDGKEFKGQQGEFLSLKHRLEHYKNLENGPTNDTKILAGQAFDLNKEWRNLIIDGEVIDSCRYKKDNNLSISADDVPEDMVSFVEERVRQYRPHDAFVMDVALTNDKYYIVECGCINSVGFYGVDIEEFVRKITEYLKSKNEKG